MGKILLLPTATFNFIFPFYTNGGEFLSEYIYIYLKILTADDEEQMYGEATFYLENCCTLVPLHFPQGMQRIYKRAKYDPCKSIKGQEAAQRNSTPPQTLGICDRGLQHVTDHQRRGRGVTNSSTPLPDELNDFYARFEALSTSQQGGSATTGATQDSPLPVSTVDVWNALRGINPRKAAGPNNNPRVCSSELTDLFSDMFNLSLL